VISLTQGPLPDKTQHSQDTDIKAPGGIRTHNPSKQAAGVPTLRPRGHRYRLHYMLNYFRIYKGVQFKNKPQTRWNLIDRSTTAPPPLLSPSSILPPPLSHCVFIPARRNGDARLKTLYQFFISLKSATSLKSRNMKLQILLPHMSA